MLMLTGLFLASCADEYKSYTPAKATTDQVYFSNELSHVFELSGFDVNEITIPVSRQNTDDDITIELGITDDAGFYNLKTKSVTFPAGASTANAVVTFDGSKLDYDQYPEGTIYIKDAWDEPTSTLLPEEEEEEEEGTTEEASSAPRRKAQEQQSVTPSYTTSWGNPSFTFSVGVPAPYESLGTGKFIDSFWEEGECDVEILRNTINQNVYRIVDPYGSFGQSYYDDNRTMYMEIEILQPGDKLWDTEITQNDLVFFPEFNTGYLHSSYGAYVKLYHPAYFYDDESTYLYNKVDAYQEDGTPGEIDLAPYFYMDDVGGWNQTTNYGIVKIIFPGYSPKDMSLEITYKGIFTDTEEKVFAVASAKIGEDVQTLKGVVVSADADPEAVADAIAEGELEATDIAIDDLGNILVPIDEELTGKLQVVIVVVEEDGTVKTIDAVTFEYYGKGDANPWVSIGTGLYTDNLVAPLYYPEDEDPQPVGPYEVEVLENKDNPGLYRLVNAYAPGVHPWSTEDDPYTSANIEINATDPEGVYIPVQSTGLDWGYGVIYIASTGGYYAQSEDLATLKEAGYLGTLVDGVITLPSFRTNSGNSYQGIQFDDDGGYYVGVADGFRLVLPEAVTSEVRKRVAAANNWTTTVRQFNGKKVARRDLTPFTHIVLKHR